MRLLLAVLTYSLFMSSAMADVLTIARQPKSYASDIITPVIDCALSQIGQKYTIVSVPWKRAQVGTQHGVYGAFFVATETADRNEYAEISRGIITNNWLFVQMPESPHSMKDDAFWEQSFTANIGTAKMRWLKARQAERKILGPINETKSIDLSWGNFRSQHSDVLLENQINFARLQASVKQNVTYKTETVRLVEQGIYFAKEFLQTKHKFLEQFDRAVGDCLVSATHPLLIK